MTSVHFAPRDLVLDDYADLALIEVDLAAAHKQHARHATLIDLDRPMPDWTAHRDTAELLVLGFPNDFSFVDYELGVIQNQRVSLRGRYVGPATGRYIHTMRVQPATNLSTFSGLSGGPVFAWVQRLGFKPQLALCGVAIQGSVSSGLVHFIEVSVLMAVLDIWGPQ